MTKIKQIFIWDYNHQPTSREIYLWNKRSNYNNSIINFIDKNPSIIKKKILSFFFNLEKNKINKKTFKDFYLIYKDFSYWDLSLFLEKSFYKHESIKELIKIIALEEIIKKKKIKEIILFTSNFQLYDFFRNFSQKNKIKFKIQNLNEKFVI